MAVIVSLGPGIRPGSSVNSACWKSSFHCAFIPSPPMSAGFTHRASLVSVSANRYTRAIYAILSRLSPARQVAQEGLAEVSNMKCVASSRNPSM